MQNIKNNSISSIDLRVMNDEYFDFMLFKDQVSSDSIDLDCLAAEINPLGMDDSGKIYSSKPWGKAVCDFEANDIGFTGVDNGFVKFDKYSISTEDFWTLYTGSTFTTDDNRFFMFPVSGNTDQYKYPYKIMEENGKKYFAFKGGFLQGFFKLEGLKYQTLPHKIESDWVLSFDVRKRGDYVEEGNTINKTHNNSGIFFYMGTRAENKFWDLYGNEEPYEPMDWLDTPFAVEDADSNPVDGYWERDTKPGGDFRTSDGLRSDKTNTYDITTDNKFVFFNRTCTGFTVNNWEEGASVTIEMEKHPEVNLFPIMNRTKTGYTVNTIDKYYETLTNEEREKDPYNLKKDISNNAFALFVDSNGAVGYKYMVRDCEAEEGYSLKTEKGFDGVVKEGEWTNITVRMKNSAVTDICSKDRPTMKIYIYVNGRLVFISKELPSLSFKALDEAWQKQEGVPYNLSLGGGTQGLMEEILPNYFDLPDKVLPLEENFAGSFIGDISNFRFFTCGLSYNQIGKLF